MMANFGARVKRVPIGRKIGLIAETYDVRGVETTEIH